MTDAERALIEAALSLDDDMLVDLDRPRGKLRALTAQVAMERLGPDILSELKHKLRAECRASRECGQAWSKLPGFLQRELRPKMVEEIYAEEGWE